MFLQCVFFFEIIFENKLCAEICVYIQHNPKTNINNNNILPEVVFDICCLTKENKGNKTIYIDIFSHTYMVTNTLF